MPEIRITDDRACRLQTVRDDRKREAVGDADDADGDPRTRLVGDDVRSLCSRCFR